MTKQEAYEFGLVAEQMAAEHLLKEGYEIRERRWKPKGLHLEVDIIARKDNVIAFVEVKARKSGETEAIEAVDKSKIRHMVRAADIYLRQQELDFDYRFDIIAVHPTAEGLELIHLPDAFLPPLSSGR